jgi:hypothetical protein
MKNTVFFDIKTQFVPHKKHILLRYRAQPVNANVRFEVLTPVTMKNVVL